MHARRKPTQSEEDTVADFFLNVAQTVKTFPPFLQAQVKSRVFTAVNSAELLICNLENPCKSSSTSDYLIPSAFSSNPSCGRELPGQPPSTPQMTTQVPRTTRISACVFITSVGISGEFNDPVDQKPVVASP
jgi:hypothetical protein